MDLGPHLLLVLAARHHGHVTVRLHTPIPVAGNDRKTVSWKCYSAIEAVFSNRPRPSESVGPIAVKTLPAAFFQVDHVSSALETTSNAPMTRFAAPITEQNWAADMAQYSPSRQV